MSLFAERLRILKDETGQSQKDIASDLGINSPQLSYFLSGREPSYDKLIEIAEYFGVTLDYLLGRSNQRNDEEKAIINDIKETVSDPIDSNAETNVVLLYKALSNFPYDNENEKMKMGLWDSLKRYITALDKYYHVLKTWEKPNYPLDDLKEALDGLRDSVHITNEFASQLVFNLLKDSDADENLKDRILLKQAFSIADKPHRGRRVKVEDENE